MVPAPYVAPSLANLGHVPYMGHVPYSMVPANTAHTLHKAPAPASLRHVLYMTPVPASPEPVLHSVLPCPLQHGHHR